MAAEQGAGSERTLRGGGASATIARRSLEPLSVAASSGRLEATQVGAMFDRIAGVYDAMNTAMTAGLHHRWRARAADLAEVGAGSRVLDVATGTGDLAMELARRVSPAGEVVGSDFAEGMLARARAKAAAIHGGEVKPRFEFGDALDLPYEDNSFDASTVGFGARNFTDLDRGLAEMTRVVRPGGRVVVLEITTPTGGPMARFLRLWFDRAVPVLGWFLDSTVARFSQVARRRQPQRGASAEPAIADAYTYLPTSVKRFPGPVALAAEMERAGLHEIRWLITAGGIIAIHAGTVRSDRA
jgi:demethylmenaquinone methyltransferase/2-methoxy-6-polyprenyl-1,4-benzoquinol methylase